MPRNSNKDLIAVVAHGLGELLPEVVFIGGAVTELYASVGMEVEEARPTDDVDCVIHITGRWKFAEFERKLRQHKFENDREKIMRWHYAGIIVDVMPDDEKILGFSNPWYAPGIERATDYALTDTLSIRIFTLPYFLASKFTALFDRGMKDLRLSKDLEDIVFCFYYNSDVVQQIQTADSPVRTYLRNSVARILAEPVIEEAIYATLPGGEVDEENVRLIMERMKDVITARV